VGVSVCYYSYYSYYKTIITYRLSR
jgi:hypothetical protein